MKAELSIDYISITSKNSISAIHPFYSSSPMTLKNSGSMGYTQTRKHEPSGAYEMRNPDHVSMGVHVVYSGQALAWLENRETDSLEVLLYHVNMGHKVVRLDISIDFFDSDISIEILALQAKNKMVKTNSKSWLHILSDTGETLYIGSLNKRKKLLRIYDKGLEQKVQKNWIRVELELHHRSAEQGSKMLMGYGLEIIPSIINGFASFPCDDIYTECMGSDNMTIRVKEEKENSTQKWLIEVIAPLVARVSLEDKHFADRFVREVMTLMDK